MVLPTGNKEYRHPVEKIREEQKEKMFPDWRKSINEVFKGDFSGEKDPFYLENADPLFLMTMSEPEPGNPRTWDHIRRNALAAPMGYDEGEFHNQPPLVNWAYHLHTPETWDRLKDNMLSSNEQAERAVINLSYTARDSLLVPFKEHITDDSETVVLNPIDVADLFTDKYETFRHLDEAGLPTIPTTKASTLFYDGKEATEAEIGSDDRGYVIKPLNGFGGDGVFKVDSLEEVREMLNTPEGIREIVEEGSYESEDELEEEFEKRNNNREEVWENYLIQTRIPHPSDIRVEGIGDKFTNAERRYSADGELCTNFSDVSANYEGSNFGVYTKILNAISEGRLEPLYLDLLDKPGRTDELGQGARNLSQEIMDSIDAHAFNFDDNLPQNPVKIGIDLLETKREKIQHLPDHWIERAEEFSDGNTLYFIPELNGMPGSGVDLAAMYADAPEQISTIHVYNLMRDLSGLDDYSVDQIVENYSQDPEGQLYQRILGFYPDSDLSKEEYLKLASLNDKRA
ncbi:MAG: RimK family alpha-L-glutamate ligase [Candidatus Paceibacteria bacterium]